MAKDVKTNVTDFDLPSGLPENFDATIVEAYFGEPPEKYIQKARQDGRGEPGPGLYLVSEGEDLEEPYNQFYSIGSNWEMGEGGKSVINTKKPEVHAFQKNSSAGKLVIRILTLAGGGDIQKGKELMAARGILMTEAEFFLGMKLHWMRETTQTAVGTESSITIPDKFYGFSENGKEEKKPAKAAEAKSPEASAEEGKLEDIVIKLAAGKNIKDLKSAIVKDEELKKNRAFVTSCVSGKRLAQMESDGKIIKDENGVFV